VIVNEQVNFRNINDDFFPEQMDIIVMDVSFISIKLLLENIHKLLKETGLAIILIKPQFEVGRDVTLEKGILKDQTILQEVFLRVCQEILDANFLIVGTTDSPIKGQKGNHEFLAYLKKK